MLCPHCPGHCLGRTPDFAAGTSRQSDSPCTPRAQAICRPGHMWLAWMKRAQFFTMSPRPIVLRREISCRSSHDTADSGVSGSAVPSVPWS